MPAPRRIAAGAMVLTIAASAATQAGPRPAKHWAFVAPVRPALPAPPGAGWGRNEVDAFVLQRLRAEGLAPAPEADRATLLRRLSLDLIGLPPSLPEIDAFLADTAADAYDRVVQRLLESPHFGERMALSWLDLARYGDTHGFHMDSNRDMWPWRDGVVEAFNRNQPFDQFTIEQLAGDLLPQPTLPQLVASGFNRNHMINVEGGADPDEYLVRYVVDRVSTTSTVWLGLTVSCAECHDHKYDPISQREFYQLYAFFDDVPEKGLDGFFGNAPPLTPTPTPAELESVHAAIAAVQSKLREADRYAQQVEREQAQWEAALCATPDDAGLAAALIVHCELDGESEGAVANAAAGGAPGRIVATQRQTWIEGLSGQALQLDGSGAHVELRDPRTRFERSDPFTIAAWVRPGVGGVVAGRWLEGTESGYALVVRGGEVALSLAHRASSVARVAAKDILWPGWNHVAASSDGSGRAAGLKLWVNGREAPVTVTGDDLTGSITTEQHFRIGSHETLLGFDGALDDVRVYARALTAAEVERVAHAAFVPIARTPAPERSTAAVELLRTHFQRHVFAPTRAISEAARPLQAELERRIAAVPTAMVMADVTPLRQAQVRIRGDYRRKGEVVEPDVPAVLPPLPAGAPRNRLALARWIVDPSHPLTARVLANRLWELLFGVGLVRTSEDFGTRCEPPSHPELLDWLATEVVRSGWDVKHMLRLLVTSSTYRQSSVADAPGLAADPEARLLSRVRRLRLPAELVRDNVLAIAGQLDLRLGGPGVRPVQPPGLWEEVAYGGGYSAQTYEVSPPQDRRRRGLYVYVKRSAPYASFRAFDVPTREMCQPRRDVTTTPMQALVLLNDPVYVEAARGLALRMLGSGGDDRARLQHGFRLCVARLPSATELDVLAGLLADQRQRYAAAPDQAAALTAVGDSAAPATLPPPELAAWTMVASALINKSETITRP